MKEIERKFLVDLEKLNLSKFEDQTVKLEQGYLCKGNGVTVRVRIQDDQKGFITIKGKTENITRDEFEYEIPVEDAKMMMNMCDKTIIKKRTTIKNNKKYWTVDVFEGENEGLVVAEIELKKEDEKITPPSWILEEVSSDSKYFNSNLISNPYKKWKN